VYSYPTSAVFIYQFTLQVILVIKRGLRILHKKMCIVSFFVIKFRDVQAVVTKMLIF
jgi:hypothetical protein